MNKALYVVFALGLLSNAAFADVNVFAAASMKNALDEIGAAFKAQTGHEIIATYAATGALARQIEQGAPADIFISADEDWLDFLAKKSLIKSATRHVIARNVLVVVGQVDHAEFEISHLPLKLSSKKIALGEVKSVPAGKYAKAALLNLKLWDAISPHIVMQDNVRGALALVARGEAKFGVVYASDAKAEPKVRVVATFPKTSHMAIVYPAAIVAASNNTQAVEFNDYLRSATAQAIFIKDGFAPLK